MPIDEAFYRLTVAQRDAAWRDVAQLAAALRRLADRVEQIELPDGSTPDTLEARALLARIDGDVL